MKKEKTLQEVKTEILTLPEELVLNEKEVLTLSDRDDSLDGRYYGTINIKDIKANAILLKTINLAKIK